MPANAESELHLCIMYQLCLSCAMCPFRKKLVRLVSPEGLGSVRVWIGPLKLSREKPQHVISLQEFSTGRAAFQSVGQQWQTELAHWIGFIVCRYCWRTSRWSDAAATLPSATPHAVVHSPVVNSATLSPASRARGSPTPHSITGRLLLMLSTANYSTSKLPQATL